MPVWARERSESFASHRLSMSNSLGLFIENFIIIVIVLNKIEDPIVSVGADKKISSDKIANWKTQVYVEAGILNLLEKISTRIHLTYGLRNIIREICELGFYNEEAWVCYYSNVLSMLRCGAAINLKGFSTGLAENSTTWNTCKH